MHPLSFLKNMREADDRKFVTEIYRALLERDPDESSLRSVLPMLRSGNLDRVGLTRSILASEEFELRTIAGSGVQRKTPRGCSQSEAETIFRRFKKYEGQGRSGFITNFLGGLTDVRFVALPAHSGTVEGFPIPGNFHGDTLEWMGTLQAVLEASTRFYMLELGAGWAPWCTIGYTAARQRRISEIKVIGVEGDAGHIEYIRDTFAANGIGPEVGQAIYGVVGTEDGIALFPKASEASRVYGGLPAYSEAGKNEGAFANFVKCQHPMVEAVVEVPCFSLATLLRGFDRLDLIHCDIQGGEAALFDGAIDLVSSIVRRIVIGTHSFGIERRLVSTFSRKGWDLEGFGGVEMREINGKPLALHDGVQVWRNGRF
jgi:FkbM family methyltransferase